MRTTPRVAGFRSEYPAGFELECMAGFVGIRSLKAKTSPEELAAAYKAMNIRDDG